MAKIIESRQLNFSWSQAAGSWFQNLDVSIEGGHIYGLLGRNGAGKTTLLKLLSGCLRPDSGNVCYVASGGELIASERDPAQLSEIVFVPENSELPNLSVKAFGQLAGALYPRFSMLKFTESLKALDVPLNGRLPRLSFGQRRKAHIAFALATDAALLLLDEPSNGLDIASQIVLRNLLIENLSPNRAFLVSTHHIREFETIIDRIIVLEHGRLLAHEGIQTLRGDPLFKDLESWYAQLIGLPAQSVATRSVNHEGL
jgi:ABC-2 type transport system ATP-binding protein